MTEEVFKGVGTALVTPLSSCGEVDYECLKRLIKRQVRLKADAVIVCGTTGEASTLSVTEHLKVIETAVEAADGKIPIIAGTGSNDTAHAVYMTKMAKSLGVKASLSVTPYYNKTTQNGLIAHYFTICDSADLPIIVYNVPTRTGLDIEVKTYEKLFTDKNIVGVKEASNDLKKITEILTLKREVCLYAGNDETFLPIAKCGGAGVISAVANIIPDKISEIMRLVNTNNYDEAKRLYIKYKPIITAQSKMLNPIGVKYMMSKLKLCNNVLRAPLLAVKRSPCIDKVIENSGDDIIL